VEAAVLEQSPVVRVEPEVAVVLLVDLEGVAVEVRGAAVGLDRHVHRPPGDLAGERRHEQPRGVRVVLGVLGVGEAEHVAGELEQHVLAAAARAERWHTALAAERQRRERAVEAAVRAAGRAAERVGRLHRRHVDLLGGDPVRADVDAELLARVGERRVGRGSPGHGRPRSRSSGLRSCPSRLPRPACGVQCASRALS
jgi:hypothetical protein